MRIGVIIAIVTDHDARNTAPPPTVPVPVPDGSRPADRERRDALRG